MAAPMAAPTTLPMPPTITTTSEASSSRVSSPGTIDSSTAPMTPPRPARPAPIANVVANTRLLLASLVVVIVGGMGSVVGAAIGAAILGLAETYGLAYAPTYSVVFTFVIMALVLAFRPQGLLGRRA